MINELLTKKERIEENKILEAIHNQAKWKNMEEENKRMMSNIDRELRKPTKKDKIKEVLQREMEIALLLVISTPGIIAWILLTFCLTH